MKKVNKHCTIQNTFFNCFVTSFLLKTVLLRKNESNFVHTSITQKWVKVGGVGQQLLSVNKNNQCSTRRKAKTKQIVIFWPFWPLISFIKNSAFCISNFFFFLFLSLWLSLYRKHFHWSILNVGENKFTAIAIVIISTSRDVTWWISSKRLIRWNQFGLVSFVFYVVYFRGAGTKNSQNPDQKSTNFPNLEHLQQQNQKKNKIESKRHRKKL